MSSTIEQMRLAFQQQNYEEVLKLSIHLHPEDQFLTEYLELRARSLQKNEQFEEAMGVWNVLISRDNKNAFYLGERSVCKYHLGYRSALDDLDAAIFLEPQNAYHYACRAYIRDKMGDTEGSIADYRFSVELDPSNEVTLNNLGLAEEKLGYTRGARKQMQLAQELTVVRNQPEPDMGRSNVLVSKAQMPASRNKLLWGEVWGMIRSRTGFRQFLRELFGRD